MNKLLRLILLLGVVLTSHLSLAVDLPNEKDIQAQLAAEKNVKTEDTKQQEKVANLEATLGLLQDIDKQQKVNQDLKDTIDKSTQQLAQSKANIEKLKAQANAQKTDWSKLSATELQERLVDVQQQLQQLQTTLAPLNAKLSAQKSAPERAQAGLTETLKRTQEINNQLTAEGIDSVLKTKLETEQNLLTLKDSYNQLLLSGNDELTALYSSQVDENTLEQQQLQTEQNELQDAINQLNLEETKKQVAQATQSQQQNSAENTNPIIVSELEFNTKLTETLLQQTTQLNTLSNDNLRIKSILDNLQQTQQNINEQISSLQGTLVLSRIINKQKQALPQDKLIKGLSKQITDLRVKLFDLSELRDNLSDTAAYIANLEKDNTTQFTVNEKNKLTTILQERQKVLNDLIKQLNSQLTLSINIELNQQQVQTISDNLQAKLQQQSFWVRSNNVIDLEWVKSFPQAAMLQIRELTKRFNFSNWKDNALWAGLIVAFLLSITIFILRQKEAIKNKLTEINNKIKTVKTDSLWNTPIAILLTIILCLPSTLVFLSVIILITYICLQDPTAVWAWGAKMASYWLYFAMMLALLRPNGLAICHFKLPQKSAENFRHTLKHSAWMIALLLNTDVLSNLDMGVSYDVVGEVLTIVVLILMLFVIGPEFRRAISLHQNATAKEQGQSYLLTLVRIVLALAPIVLIVLIVMGYYYTSLVLIDHLVNSYFAFTTWLIVRHFVYREIDVYARRLAARRLQEKRAAVVQQNAETADQNSSIFSAQDETLAVGEVKKQISRIADFLLWIGFFALFYFVWSDLITVAYYLDGVTLWQQTITTDKGTVLESVTLLNLLIAFIILAVSYILVRNIGALLEVLIFSRVKLSQGTPYTLTTLLSYIIIAIGLASAFATLGVSWAKLQWLLTALSVGLGFGMQEIFANFVSGIIILFERPVRIGDMVTISSYTGTVSKIRIRTTTLVDADKKEVIVPNKAFVTERLVNWALTDSVTRIVIQIGVAYGSDIELVRKLLLQAAQDCPKVLKEPASVAYFLSFGASTLDHELRTYVGNLSDRNPTIDFLNRRINELFAQHNIDIAFNQLDIFIKNQLTNEEVRIGNTIALTK